MENVSVDLGYGFVKAVSSNGKRVIFPSVVGEEGNSLDLSSAFGKRADDVNNMHIKFNERDFFVGKLAEMESRSTTRIFERERFNNIYTMILLNAAVHLVSESDIVSVTTGLPLDFYQAQAKEFRESVIGIQPVIQWMSGPLAGKEKRVNIENAFVFPQGASAVFSALINHEGKFVYPDLMHEGSLIALIDIGFRTTDFVVVEIQENGSFIPIAKHSGTVDEGVINLHTSLQQVYKTNTGGSDLNDRFIKQILQNGYLLYRGKKMDFTEIIKESKESIVANIVDRLNSVWSNESDLFSAIFLAGGGGTLFQSIIQPHFDSRLSLINESQFANAIGYLRLGKAMMNAKSLKEKMG